MKRIGWVFSQASVAAVALVCVAVLAAGGQDFPFFSDWPIAGQNLSNTRSQSLERVINSSNVAGLSPLWTFTTAASVSVTPVVAGDQVYFPDWAGNIYAVDRHTGGLLWSAKVSGYDGYTGAVARSSLAVYGDELIFGDNEGYTGLHNGANLIAVNRFTGGLRWITSIDSHPAAVVTGPPVVYNGVVYQGISSSEETLAIQPSYPCCTFRGSVVAVDARTGQLLWKTYDMPDNHGYPDRYSGGAIWQQPVIDPQRAVLYIGTGNNYTAPASVLACQTANPQASNCAAPDDYFDTALALDLRTGAVRWSRNLGAGAILWSRRLWNYDVWTVACLIPGDTAHCASPSGPDYDLGGAGANLLGHLIGFGQKSGIYWALDPDSGSILWSTPVGPGGTLGGIEWGTATDGYRIYVAIGNSKHTPYTLTSGQQITWGAWSALNPATGKILWQTADPTKGALDTGAVSVANGVLYAGSLSGSMYALDAATGNILWSFSSGGSVIDGPAIVGGTVYWGSGYARIGGTGNNKVYAFTVSNRRPQERHFHQ